MAQELETLLERIQRDGVAKGQVQADKLLADAGAEAKRIVQEADRKAKQLLASAEQEGRAFGERGALAVQQAARDAILTVAHALEAVACRIAAREVDAAADPATLKQMLLTMVESYCAQGQGRGVVSVSKAQQDEVADFLMGKLAAELRAGIDIKGDGAVLAGFRLSVADGRVEHDFSRDAITETLCALLRPHLAEIVRQASANAGDNAPK